MFTSGHSAEWFPCVRQGETMSDLEILECGPVPEFYTDGFSAYRVVNGVLRCTGYTLQPDQFAGNLVAVAVIRLAVSLVGADAAQAETLRVLREKPLVNTVWHGYRLAH